MDEQDQISRAVAEIMASRPTLRVGDRVRVLNRECPYCFEMPDGSDSPLSLAQVGLTATVVQVGHDHHDCVTCRCAEESDGGEDFHRHTVWVEFDDPPTSKWGLETSSHFAPSELEHVGD
jgi:hypothetical protein